MTLSTEITADASLFLDTDDFGESITHWPAGVEVDAASRTVIFVEMDRVDEDQTKGKQYLRNAVIHIASAVTITKKDVWFRNSERWETKIAGKNVSGMREVQLTRIERVKTKTKGDTERKW